MPRPSVRGPDRRIPILLTPIAVLLGAWTGWRPAPPVEAAPAVDDVAPSPSEPAAAAPCPPVGGLARPASARIDPELDPELVGSPIPWPADADPIRETGRKPTPAERHREAVRRFWIAETVSP